MRFAVEAWAPEYGSSLEEEVLEPTEAGVDPDVERPLSRWEPLAPPPATSLPERILFTDGVRRVDAMVWIEGENASSSLGICASYGAGAVLCDGRAEVVAAKVERGLFTSFSQAEAIRCRHAVYPLRRPACDSPEKLTFALQQRMGELEVSLALAEEADLVVVDGRLAGRQNVPAAVGYVKSHDRSYLPEPAAGVIAHLHPGERTPLFLMPSSRSPLYSWYLRLPGGRGHSWAGVVRCEASADTELARAVRLADTVAATLPRFASASHKDPRAPQNLYPIAGLERALWRRLGDQTLLCRGLQKAAGAA
ncbi:MAG: hypothetical protein ACRDJF_01650 [Actinomycetota bacterium]